MISDIFYILTFIMGLIIGYFLGMRKGEEVKSLMAPIELRKKSLEKGYCILCSKELNNKNVNDANVEGGCLDE